MIYEILIRGNSKPNSSDNLIWIESNLPTRSFEKWLLDRDLLNRPGNSTASVVVRWRIVQTKRPAHFVLSSQEGALERRIAELMNPPVRVKKATRPVPALSDFAAHAFSMAA